MSKSGRAQKEKGSTKEKSYHFKMFDCARSAGRCLITKGAPSLLLNRFFRPDYLTAGRRTSINEDARTKGSGRAITS
jgi:hypothetical protein